MDSLLTNDFSQFTTDGVALSDQALAGTPDWLAGFCSAEMISWSRGVW